MAVKPLKIIFAGTPDFSVPALEALIQSEHQVIAVYSQPDRPAGRGRKLTASPVKQKALAENIAVFQPDNLKDATVQQQLADLNADIMIVVAYGLILPEIVLNTPKYGCLNIHASLLPRWRGAAPIQRAIEQGDPETGVTIMQMDKGLDTGDILAVLATEIQPEDTSQTLHDRLSKLGSVALLQTLNEVQAGTLRPIKQDEEHVIYAEKLSKAEAQLDWTQDAATLVRKVQAFNPWPVAFTKFKGKTLRIWQAEIFSNGLEKMEAFQFEESPGVVVAIHKNGFEVATGNGSVLLTMVQPMGKKAMPAYDFAQARQLTGEQLG